MVARTTSGGWIISHRCSWIMVYVLCYNAQVNLIVILMTFVCLLYSINCPTVICLPNMLFTLWRDTTSELWTRSILLHCYCHLPFTCFIYILANYYLLPLNTLNPLFTANWWDWQPHRKLGQSTWLCCVQVPCYCWCKLRLGQGAIVRSCHEASEHQPSEVGSFSYWFDKP
jgi:hypothetical protein